VIAITVTFQEKPMRIIIQRYRTEETGPREDQASHTIFTFLIPLLKRLTRDLGGNMSIIT
jgi:hypothetical protein